MRPRSAHKLSCPCQDVAIQLTDFVCSKLLGHTSKECNCRYISCIIQLAPSAPYGKCMGPQYILNHEGSSRFYCRGTGYHSKSWSHVQIEVTSMIAETRTPKVPSGSSSFWCTIWKQPAELLMKQVTMHCMHPAPAPACIAGFIKLFRDAALPALPCPFPGYPCQSSLRLLSTVGNIFCLGRHLVICQLQIFAD